ncbi:MAG TPA: glycosyltransferase family 2 protein [Oscillospiraceae bacterium]|mgnify:CR=1 FL=1|nr:glycosyltransferase family 2 protein [Oscillospiraceae bacterium]HPS35108.1 glycosyltransferase family 2 protein [Oscillospiraceae bacterium]
MPKVSIITPAFNARKYLHETIQSVEQQTFTDWEMIIVDDCSKDETFNIACSFAKKDNRIKVIQNQKNSGVAATRNAALDVATGDYVAFLDSDDKWMPDKIEKQLSFMEKNGYALTYTMYQVFNSDTGKLGKIIKIPKKMTHDAIFSNTIIACLTVMVNRKMVGKFYMPLINHTEDQCTWQNILGRGYVAFGLKENLALYREGNESLTKSKIHAIKKQWKTYREYHRLSVIKSSFYFTGYAVNAIIKHF